jgi:hypothetical protein
MTDLSSKKQGQSKKGDDPYDYFLQKFGGNSNSKSNNKGDNKQQNADDS